MFSALLGIPSLRYLAEDETRIGRKTETKRVITQRRVKPKVKVQWPREAFWLYGVVDPVSGWQWMQEYPKLNQHHFQEFLNQLSTQLGESVAVMQMDRAPAHRAKALVWPENMIPLFQPAHCPELNPIERLWQYLKGRWKNENFASLEALRLRLDQEVEQLSRAQVQSLTSFNFILEALLQAAF